MGMDYASFANSQLNDAKEGYWKAVNNINTNKQIDVEMMKNLPKYKSAYFSETPEGVVVNNRSTGAHANPLTPAPTVNQLLKAKEDEYYYKDPSMWHMLDKDTQERFARRKATEELDEDKLNWDADMERRAFDLKRRNAHVKNLQADKDVVEAWQRIVKNVPIGPMPQGNVQAVPFGA